MMILIIEKVAKSFSIEIHNKIQKNQEKMTNKVQLNESHLKKGEKWWEIYIMKDLKIDKILNCFPRED